MSTDQEKRALHALEHLRGTSESYRDDYLATVSGDVRYRMLRIMLIDRDVLQGFVEDTNKAVKQSDLGSKPATSSLNDSTINMDDFWFDKNGVARMVQKEPAPVAAEGKAKERMHTVVRANQPSAAMATTQNESKVNGSSYPTLESSRVSAADDETHAMMVRNSDWSVQPSSFDMNHFQVQNHKNAVVAPTVANTTPNSSQQPLHPAPVPLGNPPPVNPNAPTRISSESAESAESAEDVFYCREEERSIPLMVLDPTGCLRPLSDIKEYAQATIRERFRLNCTHSVSRATQWDRMLRHRDKRVDRASCLRFELVRRGVSPQDNGGTPRKIADDVCCEVGSPCAYIMRHESDYVVAIVPTQERFRTGTWRELGYWVNTSVMFLESVPPKTREAIQKSVP